MGYCRVEAESRTTRPEARATKSQRKRERNPGDDQWELPAEATQRRAGVIFRSGDFQSCLAKIMVFCGSPTDVAAVATCGRSTLESIERVSPVVFSDLSIRRWPYLQAVLPLMPLSPKQVYLRHHAADLGASPPPPRSRLDDYCLALEIYFRDPLKGWRIEFVARGRPTPLGHFAFHDIPRTVGRRMARSWIAIGADNDVSVRVVATQRFGEWRRAVLFEGHAHGFVDGTGWRVGDIPLASDRTDLPAFHSHGVLGVKHALLPDVDIPKLINKRCTLRVDWQLGHVPVCFDDTAPCDDLPAGPTTLYAHLAVPDPRDWQYEKDAPVSVFADYLQAIDFR